MSPCIHDVSLLVPCPMCKDPYRGVEIKKLHAELEQKDAPLRPSLHWGDALLFIQEQKKEIEKLEEKVSGLQAQLEKDSIAFTGIIREKDKIIEGQDKSLWDLVQALELKMGAFQYDIWLLNSKLSMGTYLPEQRELVEKAVSDMVEAKSKIEEALAKHKPAGEK